MNANTPWQAVVQAPGFSLGIRCDEAGLETIEFLPLRQAEPPNCALAAETVRQLAAWLDDAGFSFNLPIKECGTPFQRKVWAAIRAIDPGKTRSYGEIAGEIGSAPRAVGQACGANPVPIVVPCHRVVSASGSLGGFAHERDGFLLEIKRFLLEREKALVGR